MLALYFFYFICTCTIGWRGKAGIENHLLDNAFVKIADWEKAQEIADGFDVARLHAKLEQWVKQFCRQNGYSRTKAIAAPFLCRQD